jgi:hypothetical protein
MKDSINAALAAVVQTVHRPGDFLAAGECALHLPLIEAEGIGPLALPLLPAQAAQLIATAERALWPRGRHSGQAQGMKQGASLLQDAVKRAIGVSANAGIRALLVHALSEPAKRLYLHDGFQASTRHPMTLMRSPHARKRSAGLTVGASALGSAAPRHAG